MRKLFTLLMCLSTIYCSAQNRLTTSRTSSYYTYIYKISDEDLLNIYNNPKTKLDGNILREPIDSVKTDGLFNEKNLPAGNYLKVSAQKNTLDFKLIERHSAHIHTLSHGSTIDFIVTDNAGNTVNTAVVTTNNKPVTFKHNAGFYSFKPSKHNIVTIKYQNVSNIFALGKQYDEIPVSWFKKKWRAIKLIFKRKRQDDYNKRYRLEYEPNGFMVFNKPKYKPNDTVRFKAYIIDEKSKQPIKLKTLKVKLYEVDDDYEEENGKLLGEVKSYAPGAFEYSFVLTDSLDLDIDDNYKIALEHPLRFHPDDDDDSGKYDDADEDEEEFMRKLYIVGQFRYEEYELKSTAFTMRTDKDRHGPGNLLNVYFKATDENDLPIPDGRVEMVIRAGYPSHYFTPKQFIPDTLWRHTLKLDPVGETKLALPDSIFPKADIDYDIHADFYNSANENREQIKTVSYKYARQHLTAELVGDTMKFAGYELGKSSNLQAWVYAISASGDTLLFKRYTLPVSIKINPYATYYQAETDSAFIDYTLKDKDSGVKIDGYHARDSVFVKVDNLRNLHFWYTIYAGKIIISCGEASSLLYKGLSNIKGPITCVVNYMWAGQLNTEKQVIPYDDKLLTIEVKQPISIYPGQKVKTEIEVKNIKGEPVPNTDITAWAFTSKFENYRQPYVPYLGKLYPAVRIPSPFVPKKLENTWNIKLDWKKWGRSIGLDSIEYYKFTHPNTIYRTEEVPGKKDTITQIAPFVIKDGDIVPVHIIYIDDVPVYFSQAQQLQRYSFSITPGTHSLRLRTKKADIYLREVNLTRHKKLIISVNADGAATADITKMPDSLTVHEANLINKYMIRVANTFNKKLATLESPGRIYVLNPELSGNSNYNNEILVGPLSENISTYLVKSEEPRSFLTEPGYTYTFLPGLLKQKSYLSKYPFRTSLLKVKGADDYTQDALTNSALDTIWQNYLDLRSNTTPLFVNDEAVKAVNGDLVIAIDTTDNKQYFIKNIIIYRNDDPDFILIHPGSKTYFNNMTPGKYRILFLLRKDDYAVAENIIVKANGKNFYRLRLIPKLKDSVSIKISSVIANRPGMRSISDNDFRNDALLIKEAFNEKYLDESTFSGEVSGTVSDVGGVLPGASVSVKGAPAIGTLTDINGRFRLKVTSTAKLIVKFIGFLPQEVTVKPGGDYRIMLQATSQGLDEVVVIGYGGMTRRSLTASVSTITSSQMSLSGRLPG
ncbi:MAG: hypothetical protein EOP47_16070, partial [Sphingobacteriaceae bacterium]